MALAGQTARLGQWAAQVSWDEAPQEVAEAIRSSLLFNLSLARAAMSAHGPAQQCLEDVLTGAGEVRAWRTGARKSAPAAAALNAALITARGQNDTHALMNGHPGCIVWPAVLALAREHRLPSRTVMAAALAGYEVCARAPGGQAHAVAARGWRCTSVYGTLGAAAACARLLGLDAGRSAHALGIAAQSAAGTMQCYAEGTPEWIWQAACASRAGVEAALLARRGLTACERALEGAHGLHRALTGDAASPPSGHWTAGELTLKAFPGCAINQSAIHLLRGLLMGRRSGGHEAVGVTLWLHSGQASHPGVAAHGPFDTSAGAFMSAPFMLQTVLEKGAIRWRDFEAQRDAHGTHSLSRRIRVQGDDTVPRFGCRLQLTWSDGSQSRGEAGAAAGAAARWEVASELSRSLLAECTADDRHGAGVNAEVLATAVGAYCAAGGGDLAGLLACAGLE